MAQDASDRPAAGPPPRAHLFVAQLTVMNPEALEASFEQHVRWMGERERAGEVVFAGPLSDAPATPFHGLSVINASDAKGARAIVESDPFISGGAMHYELREWTVTAGRLIPDLPPARSE